MTTYNKPGLRAEEATPGNYTRPCPKAVWLWTSSEGGRSQKVHVYNPHCTKSQKARCILCTSTITNSTAAAAYNPGGCGTQPHSGN